MFPPRPPLPAEERAQLATILGGALGPFLDAAPRAAVSHFVIKLNARSASNLLEFLPTH